MSQLQLQRNSEVFYSSVDLVNTSSTAMTPANTWKLDILSGFAVTASSATRDISRTQHGNNIDRSTSTYNIARNPVDWNFTTYLRCTGAEQPSVAGSTTTGTNNSGNVKPVADWFMWQSLISNTAPARTAEQSVWFGQGQISTQSTASALGSHASRSTSAARPEGSLYFKLDNVIYRVANAVVDSASLNAGINEIVTVEWSGKGSDLVELQGGPRDRAITVFGGILNSGISVAANANAAALSRQSSYHPYSTMNVAGVISSARYIKNRLSVIELGYNSNTYSFPVTNFSLQYSNQLKYISREQLGRINNVVTGYSTDKSITGSLTMYLRPGANSSTQFLQEVRTNEILDVGATANARIYIGGRSGPYVEAYMPAVNYSYPTISTEDVMSMSVDFRAQQSAPSANDELNLIAIRSAESIVAFASGVWSDSGFWSDNAVWSG